MKNFASYLLKSIVAVFIATMLFSCKGKLGEVRKWEHKLNGPSAIGKGINLFYTDSGKVKAHLKSPLMYDFSTQEFPYREFPDGVRVEFFNEEQEKNTIIADYGVIYQTTGLIDLRGNVKIVMSDSTIVHATQLYYDQSLGWVFTDVPYRVKLSNGGVNQGEGFDSNENFNNFSSRSNVGVQVIEEDEK